MKAIRWPTESTTATSSVRLSYDRGTQASMPIDLPYFRLEPTGHFVCHEIAARPGRPSNDDGFRFLTKRFGVIDRYFLPRPRLREPSVRQVASQKAAFARLGVASAISLLCRLDY